MCGRTACTLAPNDLVQSCTYINKKGKETKPTWREATNGRTYYPSYNVCPGAMTPILFSSKHLDKFKLKDSVDHVTDWSLMPMQWGLVPSWHTGDPKSVSYKMTNARSDGILDKKSFKTPLQKGRRCVVIADGYYEWHTSKDGGKQPYFIYPPSDDVAKPNDVTKVCDDTKVDDVTKVKGESHEDCSASISDESAKNGRRLMMMAGLFDIWTSETGDVLFTYSIITVDAHKHVAWIHHRMPAPPASQHQIEALNKKLELIEGEIKDLKVENKRLSDKVRNAIDLQANTRMYGCVMDEIPLSCTHGRNISITTAIYGFYSEVCSDECCAPLFDDCSGSSVENHPADWALLLATCEGRQSCNFRYTGAAVRPCSENVIADYMMIYYSCQPDPGLNSSAPIGFTAIAQEDRTYACAKRVAFDRVLTNYGLHYDQVASVFVCPVDGLYVFALHITGINSAYMYASIILNGQELVMAYTDDYVANYAASNQAVIECFTGDMVWVQTHNTTLCSNHLSGSMPYSTFSGFILMRYD